MTDAISLTCGRMTYDRTLLIHFLSVNGTLTLCLKISLLLSSYKVKYSE